MIQRKKATKVAVLFSLFSLIFLGITIMSIKRFLEKPKQIERINRTDFNLTKTKRSKIKKDIKELRKKQRKMSKKLKSLKPLLNTHLKGGNFGLDLKDMGSLDLDSELLDEDRDVVMDEGSVDQKPQVLEKKPIEFPEKALSDNILKGIVEVRILITKEGKVKNADILSAHPKGYFEDATLVMVSSWNFKPARYRGRSVAMWARQVVKFGE